VHADKLFEAMEIEFENIMDDVEVENIRNVENITNVTEYIRNVDSLRTSKTKCSKYS